MVIGNQTMEDKDRLNDLLISQKHETSNYNTYANECANPQLREDFLSILKEEHDIQADLFMEMQKRGWYPVKPADQNSITQAKQKYQAT